MSVVKQVTDKAKILLHPYWRWRRAGLWVAWIVAVLGWMVVFVLPDRYQAMTRVYVEAENLLTPLLRNITIQADIQKQLEVMQRTLLNRKNIVHVAHAADLDLNVNTEAEKEKLYEWLLRRITVKSEGHNLFTVTYPDTNPRLARKVVETLLNIFVESNLGLNRSGMETARNFIENQISEYEQKLKRADERLADYKSRHADMLAATGANYSNRYDNVRQELLAAKGRYDDAVVARTQLRTGLEANPQFLDIDNSPQVMVTTNGSPAAATSARGRVLQLQAELAHLQARYTSRHPDVTSVKRALEQARIDAEEERKLPPDKQGAVGGGRGRVSNPVHEQVKLRLIQAESDVAQAESRVQVLTKEMARLQSVAELAPRIEAELAGLNRDYGVLKVKFEELLTRRESAHISEAVEASDDKLHFRIIEPPQVPVQPNFPNRPLFNTGILLIALTMGGGFMVLLRQLDDTVSSTGVLAEEFSLLVIGVIPRVKKIEDIFSNQHRGFIFSLLLMFLIYIVVLALNHFIRFSDVMSISNLPTFLQRFRDYAG